MTGSVAIKHPPPMTVDEFLRWPGDGTGRRYELVDGQLRAQDATTVDHGSIHTNLTVAIGTHLKNNRPGCLLVVAPGVEPHLRADWNFRIPDLGERVLGHGSSLWEAWSACEFAWNAELPVPSRLCR